MGKSTLILPYTAHEQFPNHKIESLLLRTYCTIATREKKDDVHLDDKLSFLSAVNPTGLLASPENASDTKPLVPGVGRVIAVVKKDFAYRDPHPFPILACEKIKMGFSLVETLFFCFDLLDSAQIKIWLARHWHEQKIRTSVAPRLIKPKSW